MSWKSRENRQFLENPKYERRNRNFWKFLRKADRTKTFQQKVIANQSPCSSRGIPLVPQKFLAIGSPKIEIEFLARWKGPSTYATQL